MKRLTIASALVLLWSSLTYSPVSLAADEARKALAKAQYLLRQSNAEKAKLQTQIQDLQAQLAQLEKDHASDIKQANKREKKLKATLAKWQSSHGKLRGSLGDTRDVLTKAKRKMALLGDDLAKQGNNFALCYKNNLELAKTNQDLLQMYENKGVWQAFKHKEVVTGLHRVKVENLIQEKQYQIEDLNMEYNQHLVKPINTSEQELAALQVLKKKTDPKAETAQAESEQAGSEKQSAGQTGNQPTVSPTAE